MIQRETRPRDRLTEAGNGNKALDQVILKILQILHTDAEPEQARVCIWVRS